VEIQDASGTPIPEYSLADAVELVGNHLERHATWNNGSDISRHAGTPVRFRFVLKEANLYALRFSKAGRADP
jgi:hypothetical protein